ncbi:ankyrin repeat-containing domain protein [Aspergillus granulosus]|uniref:Ankyrin repeat-containing domain protein n=1 Tax=Aspergillus granulosus TaxID=176169 RepID=A0ABR4HD78_9EURO
MENSLPFLSAAAMGDTAAIEREYLKNKGVLAARNPERQTALHLAALHGHPKVLRLLLSYGMCLAASDAHGQIPLHLAAQGRSTDVVEILLKEGSDCALRDNAGKTAIAYAYNNPSHDILVCFLDSAPVCGVGCSLTPEIVLGSAVRNATASRSSIPVPYGRAATPNSCPGSVKCR